MVMPTKLDPDDILKEISCFFTGDHFIRFFKKINQPSVIASKSLGTIQSQ